jgi:hypothetical protein
MGVTGPLTVGPRPFIVLPGNVSRSARRGTHTRRLRPIPSWLREAAYHEAGHAVMRWVHGLPPTPIVIRASLLRTCTAIGPRITEWTAVDVTLAGLVAELNAHHEPRDMTDVIASRAAELDPVREFLTGDGHDASDATVMRLMNRISERFRSRSRSIDAVARHLMTARHLSPRALTILLAVAPGTSHGPQR